MGFESLTGRFSSIVRNLQGRGRLTPENIAGSLRDIRRALLEADVGLDVVKEFIDTLSKTAEGAAVTGSLTPGQTLIKIVRDQLTELMGTESSSLNLSSQAPVVILVVGLQGAGKTTTVAKLAKWLIEKQKKKVGVVSCDTYRPAASEQLRILSSQVAANYYPSTRGELPIDIGRRGYDVSRRAYDDVLIVDTAGRLTIDALMMQEISGLHEALSPHETLFIVDSMMGQDAVMTAKSFDDALPLTGIILTKMDGDSRGGAALSVRKVTGKPIKFLGSGEKMDGLESFHPDRIASRILGMGDVLSLIEEAEEKVDIEKAAVVAKKIKSGTGFDLQDFRDQLHQMNKMGGMKALLGKLPGTGNVNGAVQDQVNDRAMMKLGAIIDSMTVKERQFPALIKGSRKKRIAVGSGTLIPDVNKLLKQFDQMQKMMKKMSKKGGMKNLMRGMGGQLPPNFPRS
jgi:signal recognition particle subunit SRP54